MTLRLKNGEIRQNYYFFAELTDTAHIPDTCDEGRLEWVKTDDVPNRKMPFTARDVLGHYLEIGRHDSMIYAGCALDSGTVFDVLE